MKNKSEVVDYSPRVVIPIDDNKKNCVVTDLDGTIALINGRSYYDATKYDTDILNKPIWEIIKTYVYGENQNSGKEIELIIVTGRGGSNMGRTKTINWLKAHGINFSLLYMRAQGDYRNDYIVKSEIIKELQKTYNILVAFDDRDSSAKAFRDNGVVCLQVWQE